MPGKEYGAGHRGTPGSVLCIGGRSHLPLLPPEKRVDPQGLQRIRKIFCHIREIFWIFMYEDGPPGQSELISCCLSTIYTMARVLLSNGSRVLGIRGAPNEESR